MSSGWIKLHRSLLDDPIWLRQAFTLGQAFVDLLLLASHKDRPSPRGDLQIRRGQLITSQVELARRWRRDRKTVRRFLNLLKRDQKLSVKTDKRRDKAHTLITILNYETYQRAEDRDGASTGTSKGTTTAHQTGHQKGHLQERKNVRRKEDPPSATSSPPGSVWNEYLKDHSGQKEIFSEVAHAIAGTQKCGKDASSILDSLARKMAEHPEHAVIRGCQIYLEHSYAAAGKGEAYLLGIIRNEALRNNTPLLESKTDGQRAVEAAMRAMDRERAEGAIN